MKLLKAGLISAMVGSVSLTAGGDIGPGGSNTSDLSIHSPTTWSTDYDIGLKVGTLGIGIDISRMITDKIGLRANINGFKYNRTEDLDDISYDADLKFLSVGLLADYYPFETAFRVSAGAYYNGNKLEGTATPSASQTIDLGNNTYTGDQIGRIDAEVEFNKFSPYIGIGWGNKESKKGWGFSFDLGVMYQGSPDVYANAVPNPSLAQEIKDQIKADVEVERKNIEDDVEDFKWYPVIMIGVTYAF